jgi:hypothetical protein
MPYEDISQQHTWNSYVFATSCSPSALLVAMAHVKAQNVTKYIENSESDALGGVLRSTTTKHCLEASTAEVSTS